MTLDVQAVDIGRTTVALHWTREWNDPGQPSSYVIYRRTPPRLEERLASVIAGRRFIDPNCAPSTTYIYRVAAIGLAVPEDDSVTVTTRPPTEYPDVDAFWGAYLSKIMARDQRGGAQRWCVRWHEHPEALEVVTALWRAYEAHRPPDDPSVPSTERAVWLTVFAYPLMEKLWDLSGGLSGCSRHPSRTSHKTFPPLDG